MLEVINQIISCIIQVIGSTYIVGYISQKKFEFNVKNILSISIMTILFCLFMQFDVGIYKTLFMYVIMIVGYKIIYKLSMNTSMIINFISLIIHIIGEIIISVSIMSLKIPENIIKQYFQITPISGLLMLVFIYLTIHFLGKIIIKFKNQLQKEKWIFIFYILLVSALIIMFWKNLPNWKDVNIKNFTINIFIITLFVTTIILLFKGRYDVYKTNNKFNELFEQSESVKTLLQRYKKYNHENKNQLILIRENSKGNEKVIEYINSILEENSGHEDKWISELTYVTDPGISGFLSVKINQMLDNGMNVILTISPKVKNFNFNCIKPKEYKELCRVIGIYIDNAYEASKLTEKKEVTIELLIDNKKLLMIISNSYQGTIDLEKLDIDGYTTKGIEHGTGLSIVRDIMNNNKKLEQKKEIIKDYYYQYLYIKI